MEIQLAALADYASVTVDNKLVLAGILDTLRVPRLPATHSRMALVVRLRLHPGEPPEHKFAVRLVDPDGSELIGRLEGSFRVEAMDPVEGAGAQFIAELANVKFERPGRHGFDIFIDDRFEKTVGLNVVVVPPREKPEAEPTPGSPGAGQPGA